MRILIDLTSLADNFSGIERFASNIAYHLLMNNNENSFILIFKNQVFEQFKKFENYKNIRTIIAKGNNKIIFTQLILPRYLYKFKVDVYLFMAFPAPLLFCNKNSITTIHDIGCWDFPDAMKKSSVYFFRILYRKAALFNKKIITVSNFSRKRIIEKLKCKSENIWIINNGLSDVFMNYEENIDAQIEVVSKYKLPDKYLLCLSTLEPRKNLRLLIEAYSELLSSNNIEQDLVLAGRKGWKTDDLLENLSKNVVEKIHFTGFIDDQDLPIVYKKATCFVFPSLYEGFGIPPIEALAMGIHVVSSDSSSLPEVLGDSAIYFQNGNKQDLKDKIIHGLKKSYNSKGKNNRAYSICRKYNWNDSARTLYSLLVLLHSNC